MGSLDKEASINSVSFYVNGVLVGTDSEAPFEWDWASIEDGEFTIVAEALNSTGEKSSAEIIARSLWMPVKNMISDLEHLSVRGLKQVGDLFFVLAGNGIVYESSDLENWTAAFEPINGAASSLEESSGYVFTNDSYFCNVAQGKEWEYQVGADAQSWNIQTIGSHFFKTFAPTAQSAIQLWHSRDLKHWSHVDSDPLRSFTVSGVEFGEYAILYSGNSSFADVRTYNEAEGMQPLELSISGSILDLVADGERLLISMKSESGDLKLYSTEDLVNAVEIPLEWESNSTASLSNQHHFKKLGGLFVY